MFCFKCGKQLSNDAVFCQFCGIKQAHTNSSVTVSQNKMTDRPGELDHDALKIYLGNLLALEYLKARYETSIGNLKNRISGVKNYYLKSYQVNDYGHCVHFLYQNGLYLAWNKCGGGPYSGSSLWRNEHKWVSFGTAKDIALMREDNTWKHFCNSSSGFFTRWQQSLGAKDAFFDAYENFKNHAPATYKNTIDTNLKNTTVWKQTQNGMAKELETIRQLLTQAYDVNIIPSQFRHNIHTLYYFHEFVSTSQESFTTAMLHFDLDKIKEKLDTIIRQQENMIIQNAVKIAQNNALLRQNQQQLERLAQIETNTNYAAQYAKIAANNAETCKWLCTAKYLQNR